MVGGIVVETLVLSEKVWVNCSERRPGHRCPEPSRHECAIYIENTPEARSISVGDNVWWQGIHAMWTPRNRAFEDKKLKRVGFSGVRRPDAEI